MTATLRRAAERATLALPFLIPAKDWFSLGECARLSGMSESYVEKKFDEGTQLAGHSHNGGTGARTTKRVPRAWLIAWMLETATYDDESLCDAYVACLRHFPAASLERIAGMATRLAETKKFSPAPSGALLRAASGQR